MKPLTSFFSVAIGLLALTSRAQAVCYWNWQCHDSNPCTTDTCNYLGICVHSNVSYGTPCNMNGDACLEGVCSSGSCVSAGGEWCFDGVDNDCDSYTDERHPNGVNGCEGPRGSYELQNWWKSEPSYSGDTDNFIATGDECDFSEDCDSGVCAAFVADPSLHSICVDEDMPCPSGTAQAMVDPLCEENYLWYCVPSWISSSGWSTIDALMTVGAGNNVYPQLCRWNSDCAGTACVRTGTIGVCSSGYDTGDCEVDEYVMNVVYPTDYDSVCVPSSVYCSGMTAADSCTTSNGGTTWSCP